MRRINTLKIPSEIRVNIFIIYHIDLIFTEADDNIIENMKATQEFKNLAQQKGIDRIQEREDFLLG